MKFEGAVVKEQRVTFGIVVVKEQVLRNSDTISNMQAFGRRAFGMMPIILMAQNSAGRAQYYGRKDIVNFLAKIDPRRIPFKEYTLQ